MIINKADYRLINFAPAVDVASLSARNTKSAHAYELGLRQTGVSLYAAAAAFSLTGKPHNAALARTWICASYLAPKGFGITSEHMSAGDYLARFTGNELELERSSLPVQALQAPNDYTLLVCYVFTASEHMRAVNGNCIVPALTRLPDGSMVEPVVIGNAPATPKAEQQATPKAEQQASKPTTSVIVPLSYAVRDRTTYAKPEQQASVPEIAKPKAEQQAKPKAKASKPRKPRSKPSK